MLCGILLYATWLLIAFCSWCRSLLDSLQYDLTYLCQIGLVQSRDIVDWKVFSFL